MDMQNEPRTEETVDREPKFDDLTSYVSYEEDDSVVICDRKNPKAWIKSDETSDVTS